MPDLPAGQPPGTITVLSLSPAGSDHADLEQIFRESGLTLYPNCRLVLQPGSTLASTLAVLRGGGIPIVICDGDAHPSAWREIVQAGRNLSAPPCVIVTSRLADDRLWAELLNQGAYDLLSKPFDKSEVIRIVHTAWVHWQGRYAVTDASLGCQQPATGT